MFVVERRAPDGRSALLAHKRYRPMELSKGVLEAGGFSKARTFTADADYLAGRVIGSSRDRRAVARRSAHGRRVAADRWARDEYDAWSAPTRPAPRCPIPSSSRATAR